MQPILVLQLMVLVAVANAIPVFAKKIFGHTLSWPLDGGTVFVDGQRLLGASKTIRGVFLSVLLTPLAAVLVGLRWNTGLVVALSAMAGDAASSFLKRRMGLPSSSKAIGLDQIPEAFFSTTRGQTSAADNLARSPRGHGYIVRRKLSGLPHFVCAGRTR